MDKKTTIEVDKIKEIIAAERARIVAMVLPIANNEIIALEAKSKEKALGMIDEIERAIDGVINGLNRPEKVINRFR